MKVLFVSSGNKRTGISPLIHNQAESLRNLNKISVEHFGIQGNGLGGYLKHLLPLIKYIKTQKIDVIHAHYSLCGFLAAIIRSKPVVVSIMGSYPRKKWRYFLVKICARYLWSETIVKSERTAEQLGLKNLHVIPNGVQVEKFLIHKSRESLRRELKFIPNKKYIVFVSNPDRPEKNFKLCKDSVVLLDDSNIELIAVYNKPHDEVIKYMIAADVLMLTSFNEGSPNVIKEAMVACTPIVATNVGDIKYILGKTKGCYVLNSYTAEEGALKLKEALRFGQRTKGLDRLISLGLSANDVAKYIIRLYEK